MKGTHCPNCNTDIGTAAIIKAAWHTRIKCPHCNTRLVYKPTPWLMLLLYILIYAFLVFLFLTSTSSSEQDNSSIGFILNLVIIFLLWQPFEFIIAKYLRKTRELVKYEKS